MTPLKHTIRLFSIAANAARDLDALIDCIRDLRGHLPDLPPDFGHSDWGWLTTMDLWYWIEHIWHLV
jgi:hypothetical protein